MRSHWKSAVWSILGLLFGTACSLQTDALATGDGGRGMDAARPDTGAPDAGEPVDASDAGGGECSGPSDCAAGRICCGGECAAPGCDDGNPCTDDACGASGCEHVNNADSCDDGVFCNGADICAGGTCSAHAGDPCPGESLCDEDAETCTGCERNADCPEDIPGGWGSCMGFDDTCDETGAQEREVTSYSCSAGTCEASTTTDARPCTRSTGDTPCGTPTIGGWGPCENAADACSYDGMQERTIVQPVCSSGSCVGSTSTTESRGCTRDTDGDTCEDGDLCTSGDVCTGESCEPLTATTCNDGNVCTADSCDPSTGSCLFTPRAGSCDDGDNCTADRCEGGACVSECDDGDPCTDDRCHPSMGCKNTSISGCTSGG